MFTPNFYLKTLKSQFQNPTFYSPISHLHNHITRKPTISNPAIEFVLNEVQESQFSKSQFNSPSPAQNDDVLSKVQITHPWREWVDLMEILLKKGYFDAIGNPFANNGELGKKEANLIRTACLNFSRDQYQLIRYLSRKDILVIAGSGCPSTDRKVVNSGKRLRAHVGINEGNVCSSCILRGDCDRAYVEARVDEGGRTVDVMRVLLTYCLDPILSSVENKPCLNKKVKESVKTLLKEMMAIRVEDNERELPKATASEPENDINQETSQSNIPMKQGDWICPKCKFLNFARNVKCLRCDTFSQEKLKVIAEDQDQLPLKKGDWICDKCKFLNFARNTRCLLCKEKPPKRKINPGEWECESCNYINFRRNMVCLKCDHKRPIASATADVSSQLVSNSAKNDETQPWSTQEKRFWDKADESIRFVKSERLDHDNSGSWDQQFDFMDFPVVGGKSDLSQTVKKQEFRKMKMKDKCGTEVHEREYDEIMINKSSVVCGRIENLASDDDDDDEMAEWFGRSSKSIP
ncbi:hypothetical protein ACJIZ3_019542 [Penstemon smallii]|uniref:RanBP2-type domain-containing protein n=1 Tax=Penstemon smallii TaxID=265156 RepID=A0ABD3T2E8_9LAMI